MLNQPLRNNLLLTEPTLCKPETALLPPSLSCSGSAPNPTRVGPRTSAPASPASCRYAWKTINDDESQFVLRDGKERVTSVAFRLAAVQKALRACTPLARQRPLSKRGIAKRQFEIGGSGERARESLGRFPTPKQDLESQEILPAATSLGIARRYAQNRRRPSEKLSRSPTARSQKRGGAQVARPDSLFNTHAHTNTIGGSTKNLPPSVLSARATPP